MAIYPYISYYDGTETYKSGRSIARGYYVRWQENESYYITPLDEWFRDRYQYRKQIIFIIVII